MRLPWSAVVAADGGLGRTGSWHPARRGAGRAELLAGPIHGAPLGADQLAEKAREVGRRVRLRQVPRRRGSAPLLVRLSQTRKLLDEAYRRLALGASLEVDVGPAGEWLLDNYHVVQDHIQDIRQQLPAGYYRELPELATGPLAGYPRVYELAIALISHTEARIDTDNLEPFVAAYQESAPLSIGELWALPAMLRLALIESVRRMALRTVDRLVEMERADAWTARIEAASRDGAASLGRALDAFVAAPPPLTPVFVARFLRRVRQVGGAHTPLEAIEQWVGERAMSDEDATARSTQHLALTRLMMAHSITSLRTIGRLDWHSLIERQSRLESVLRGDPSGYYSQMTFATRDRYRHVAERIGRRSGGGEDEVARTAVELARAGLAEHGAGHVRAHVGFFLVDAGLGELEASIGYRPPFREAVNRWLLARPAVPHMGGLAVATVVATGMLILLAGRGAQPVWLLVVLLGLIPAAHLAVTAMNLGITTWLPPRELAALDLHSTGVAPEGHRTAVVVPTLLDGAATVAETFEQLEVHYLANRAPNLRFAVLADFTDATTQARPEDAGITAAAVGCVDTLNAKYAGDAGFDPFCLFLRPRLWNDVQRCWMGWERKRGKLANFNGFVLTGDRSPFASLAGDVDAVRGAAFVITLDADTVLPPGAALDLVGALAHPLNRPVYDDTRRRVIRGYGIIQPRVGVSLPSACGSRFAAIHAGNPGVDPYTTASSDVYQDLYGEGSFTGKGIYDVEGFERATRGRFPENTLLSHDLIEGSYARAGLASGITVYDDYPAHYLTFTRRKHRWIRGDWQLLRWLTRHVPGPDGLEPNRLPVLARWKLLDNLRRSTVEIGQFLFLVAGWTLLPGSPLTWTALGLGAIAGPWVIALGLALLRPPSDSTWRVHLAHVGREAVTGAQQVGLAIVFLPHQAWISADAIVRTLWRLAGRRRLLDWQTASAVERAGTRSRGATWRAMWPATALAAATAGAVALVHAGTSSPAPWLSVAFIVALWLMAPLLAHALSAAPARGTSPLTTAQRARALDLARLHWDYFDRYVTADTQWLAPDNFQEDPDPVVAMRTSPTNIGLQLLAIGSARDLGFISVAVMTERFERVFASLARLRRYRGHFFNWYDLHDLRVLEPAYISTVDSGNLAGHLIAVRQACLEAAPSGDGLRPRLDALAQSAARYVADMDFSFLFDADQELFSIGYRHGDRALDSSSYDLLASEARLASYIAVARNDVPVSHWFRLGRALTRVGTTTSLVSWSGSMFEYLMPALVMRTYPRTLLDHTYRGAVRLQIAHGRRHGVPWGASESAYNVRDRELTYQYRAFGIPDLGLKRGLERDLVIAPYASALALVVDPAAALANLERLSAVGALGPHGFRDALDYTRPEPGREMAVVGTYMAHHIGMSLVALSNVLSDGAWLRRFHEDPLVRSAELLLHERIPRQTVQRVAREPGADLVPPPEVEQPVVQSVTDPDGIHPRVSLLGRQPYTVMLNHCGSGYSRFEDLAVTRWRVDDTADTNGQFCYVCDVTTGRVWSAAHQPVCAPADEYRALLATDRVTFERSDGDIETRTEVTVVPDDGAEVRRVSVTNRGSEARELELTSFGEIVLGPADADAAHRAFANLFVETEWHEWCSAIMATRRPRSAEERRLWCVHVVDTDSASVGPVTCETDRARFIGRGRTTRMPAAALSSGALSGTTGAVLDPVFALRVRLRVEPGATASAAFTTLVATSRERAFALADRYHGANESQRALDLAWTMQQVELRELGVTSAEAADFMELAGHVVYPRGRVRSPAAGSQAHSGSRQDLWSEGISGDLPVVLATIDGAEGLPTLKQVFAAHHLWRRRGLRADLVVLNTRESSYLAELTDQITDALFASSDTGRDRPGGVFVRSLSAIDDGALRMLRASAAVVLHCDGRPLSHVLHPPGPAAPPPAHVPSPEASRPRRVERQQPGPVRGERRARPDPEVPSHAGQKARAQALPPHAEPPRDGAGSGSANGGAVHGTSAAAEAPLLFDNGIGGLASSGEYVIRIAGDALPPAPWLNVIANERAGFTVSERGVGFTWVDSSYFFRLTPWHNDPVSDPLSDVLYLTDVASGVTWCPTPGPIDSGSQHVVRHGAGRSTFESRHDDIGTTLTLAMASEEPVRISLLRLTNHDVAPRRLRVTAYVEWTLGVSREQTRHHVRTRVDPARSAIFASNGFDPEHAGHVAFIALGEPLAGHTTDRLEFLGRNGSVAAPAGLRREQLGGGSEYEDPCAALQCLVELAPGETRTVVVLLGAEESEARAHDAIVRFRAPADAAAAIEVSTAAWRRILDTVVVRTPDPAFDAMLNHWLLYQTLSCRIHARSALYQSSGAYGFRDQLQDCLAALHAMPGLARRHILRAAARQFTEGDVQHWWHPGTGSGVRTRFSDDLAWLPYVVDQYVETTGDAGILEEQVPFLAMRELEIDEHETYERPQVSDMRASVYEHCVRALRRACTSGPHGLPLIGTGDWNDGMNRVGIGGRGESVWLAWFLVATLRSFAQRADARGAHAAADGFRARADGYAAAVEAHGWDGAWYRRAFFDDGSPLGSAGSDECRIDAIAQSWSVLSGAGLPERQRLALRAVDELLVDHDARILRLLAPPFNATGLDPGYIRGYLPGVRENGAQYTHAAAWSVMATALRGDHDRAFELYRMLNPLLRTCTPDGVATYRVEPYVIAADVYAAAGQVGRGGWTWYTGAAGWLYRVGLETILGVTRRGDTLCIEPRVPRDWSQYSIDYRFGSARYSISVLEPHRLGSAGAEFSLDGRPLDTASIRLVDDGHHHRVVVRPRGVHDE